MGKHLKLIKTVLFIILIIMFSSCKKTKKEDIRKAANIDGITKDHYYDFNFRIAIYRNPIGVSKEIIYQYSSATKKASRFKVMYFDYNNKIKSGTPLERDFTISTEEMDTIFGAIMMKITPKYLNNEMSKKIPSPPTYSNEWEYCIIELDLLYRGDKYVVTSRNTDFFYDLLKLL